MTISGPHAVQDFMTPDPVTAAPGDGLATVAALMRSRRVRHLPVLDGDRLVGVVSERDLHVARTLRGVRFEETTVSVLMNDHPLTVGPGDPLSDVAALMVDRVVGSAVVVHEGRVVGIFTTIDALLALHRLAAPRTDPRRRPPP